MRIRPKQVADGITGARAVLALLFAWLGLTRGAAVLAPVGWLLLLNWTGDSVDGVIARRQRPFYHTWLGDHDLEVDIGAAAGLLVYLAAARFVPPLWAGAYVLLWLALFIVFGVPRSLGMLAQAPVYGWFVVMALRHAPAVGWAMVAWVVLAIAVTWPKFPQEVVPGFLGGMRGLDAGQDGRTHHEPRS
jgi:hypothetical protein